MDPRLYHFDRRTPRLNNPTFKSQFVNDSLHIFRGGPLDSSSLRKSSTIATQSPVTKTSQGPNLSYHPPQISKIRSAFQNNRSKVPLSNLSSYARQIMFPTQRAPNPSTDQPDSSYIRSNPQKFLKPQLFLDNKQKNYIKTICKMNDQYLTKSRLNHSLDYRNGQPAGRPSVQYNDKDKRYYRYKHSSGDYQVEGHVGVGDRDRQNHGHYQSLSKPFVASRLNYADQLKGII